MTRLAGDGLLKPLRLKRLVRFVHHAHHLTSLLFRLGVFVECLHGVAVIALHTKRLRDQLHVFLDRLLGGVLRIDFEVLRFACIGDWGREGKSVSYCEESTKNGREKKFAAHNREYLFEKDAKKTPREEMPSYWPCFIDERARPVFTRSSLS